MAEKIRKKRKFKCPNPLFEQWITEWRDSAKEKGLNSRFNYSKALSSLKKYPLPLASGKEAKILEFFGDKICKMLDEKLEQHYAQCSSDDDVFPHKILNRNKSKNVTKQQSLTTLGTSNQDQSSSSAISKLSVNETRSVRAMPLVPDMLSLDPVLSKPESLISTNFDINKNSFTLHPEQFDIFLCVDNCETISGLSKSRKKFLSELQSSGLNFLIRKLNVGDFLWIAKERSTEESRELVLDFVIERKRLDDLAKSIKDGRFKEQKFRLKACGLKRPIYLVEESNHAHCGLPIATLEQAVVNTQIVDGFTIKHTKDIKESALYLSNMTRFIQNTFQNRILKSASMDDIEKFPFSSNLFLTFTDFNRGAVKTKVYTVKEMFVKHLLQFYGISPDRAAAIADRFETPAKFFQFFRSCSSENEQIKVLSELRYGKYQRPLGQAIAKVVQQYYCNLPHM